MRISSTAFWAQASLKIFWEQLLQFKERNACFLIETTDMAALCATLTSNLLLNLFRVSFYRNKKNYQEPLSQTIIHNSVTMILDVTRLLTKRIALQMRVTLKIFLGALALTSSQSYFFASLSVLMS